MKNWSTSTKVTVGLVAVLLLWVVGRSIGYGRMVHTISYQTATPQAVEAARKLILQKKLARVFKDSTNHAKFQAIRTCQVFATELDLVEIEGHHLSMAQAAAGAMVEFLSDLELAVRAEAATALGRMGKPAARPLIDDALNSPDKDVRSNAAKALVAIGEPAVPEMIEAVKTGKPTQKVGAANALGELGTTRAIGALIGALSAKEQEVRLTCRDSLVTLGPAAVDPLIGALTNKSPFTRRHSAEALGELRDARAAQPLLALLGDEHRQVRLAAMYAVGKVADPIATQPLLAELRSDDREFREAAAVSLGQIADGRAVPLLVASLDDPVEAVREQAAAALGRIQPAEPAVLASIEAVTASPDEGARRAAVFALGQIGNPASVPVLARQLDHAVESSFKVRRRAAEALGRIDNPAAIPALLSAFGDPDWRVNYAAQAALASLGQPAVAPLMTVLQGDDVLRARYARKALVIMAVPPVAELAQLSLSPRPELRIVAALGLGEIKQADAKEALLAMASDSDPGVKQVVEHVISGQAIETPGPEAATEQPTQPTQPAAPAPAPAAGDAGGA